MLFLNGGVNGGGKLAKRGRLRIFYKEKMRVYMEMKKQGGAVRIDCYLPSEYKELLKRLCTENNVSMGDGICYLLDFYFENDSVSRKGY